MPTPVCCCESKRPLVARGGHGTLVLLVCCYVCDTVGMFEISLRRNAPGIDLHCRAIRMAQGRHRRRDQQAGVVEGQAPSGAGRVIAGGKMTSRSWRGCLQMAPSVAAIGQLSAFCKQTLDMKNSKPTEHHQDGWRVGGRGSSRDVLSGECRARELLDLAG